MLFSHFLNFLDPRPIDQPVSGEIGYAIPLEKSPNRVKIANIYNIYLS